MNLSEKQGDISDKVSILKLDPARVESRKRLENMHPADRFKAMFGQPFTPPTNSPLENQTNTIMKFRKKPIIVEAVQYTDKMRLSGNLPEGVHIVPMNNNGDMPVIHTFEGELIVREGDWIVTGIKGNQYLCHPDFFEANYEAVDEPTPANLPASSPKHNTTNEIHITRD